MHQSSPAFALYSCSPHQPCLPPRKHKLPPKPRSMRIYESHVGMASEDGKVRRIARPQAAQVQKVNAGCSWRSLGPGSGAGHAAVREGPPLSHFLLLQWPLPRSPPPAPALILSLRFVPVYSVLPVRSLHSMLTPLPSTAISQLFYFKCRFLSCRPPAPPRSRPTPSSRTWCCPASSAQATPPSRSAP